MRQPSCSVEGGAGDSESHSPESTVLMEQAGDEQDSQDSSSFLSVLDSVGFVQESTVFRLVISFSVSSFGGWGLVGWIFYGFFPLMFW